MFFQYLPWNDHLPAGYERDRAVAAERRADARVSVRRVHAGALAGGRLSGVDEQHLVRPAAAGDLSERAVLALYGAAVLVVPLPRATVVIAVLRLLVGGLGMFVFLRTIRPLPLGRRFGRRDVHAQSVQHACGSSIRSPGVPPWLPWMLIGGEMVATGRDLGVTVLAVTTALVFCGGHPHTGLFLATLGGAYAVLRAAVAPHRVAAIAARLRGARDWTALAAIQVLPFLEYLSLSRAVTTRYASALNPYFAPASTLITALVPNFLGHHGSGNFAGPSNYFEQQIYPGVATWLLAAVAGCLFAPRRRRTWFFARGDARGDARHVRRAGRAPARVDHSVDQGGVAAAHRHCRDCVAVRCFGAFGAEEVLSQDRDPALRLDA